MRRLVLACFLALSGSPAPSFAQEPLFLRIRPNDAERPSPGSSDGLSDEALAAKSWAEHEAVWERSARRARIAIASVCNGCLPAPSPERNRSPATPVMPAPGAPAIERPAPVPETAELSTSIPEAGDL